MASDVSMPTANSALRTAGTVLMVALLLAGVALWNGYPLVYYDSEDYVRMSFTFDLVIFRTMPYGLFMTVARPVGSLWAVVGFQALIVAWVLHETVAAFAVRPSRFLAIMLAAILAGLTGMAWNVGQLMADSLTGAAVLGPAALAFGGDRLSLARRWVLAGLTAVAIVVHLSHVALSAGILLSLVGLWVLAQWRLAPKPRLGMAALSIVAGIAALPLIHWATIGQPVFSMAGQVLQLALFSQDGTAKLYLDKHCPEGAALKLCRFKDRLPTNTDDFLWGKTDFPFWTDLGGWEGMRDEAAIIVRGTVAEFPLEVGLASLRNVGRQLLLVGTGEGLDPKVSAGRPGEFIDTVTTFYPADYPAFRAARQQQPPGYDFKEINSLHRPLAFAMLAGNFLILAWAWRHRPSLGGLATVVVLAVLGNAIICGAGSNPHDRYQNRVAWLPMVVVILGGIAWAGREP